MFNLGDYTYFKDNKYDINLDVKELKNSSKELRKKYKKAFVSDFEIADITFKSRECKYGCVWAIINENKTDIFDRCADIIRPMVYSCKVRPENCYHGYDDKNHKFIAFSFKLIAAELYPIIHYRNFDDLLDETFFLDQSYKNNMLYLSYRFFKEKTKSIESLKRELTKIHLNVLKKMIESIPIALRDVLHENMTNIYDPAYLNLMRESISAYLRNV